jgi:hypothetical protein
MMREQISYLIMMFYLKKSEKRGSFEIISAKLDIIWSNLPW